MPVQARQASELIGGHRWRRSARWVLLVSALVVSVIGVQVRDEYRRAENGHALSRRSQSLRSSVR
jgi:hypothetical protein